MYKEQEEGLFNVNKNMNALNIEYTKHENRNEPNLAYMKDVCREWFEWFALLHIVCIFLLCSFREMLDAKLLYKLYAYLLKFVGNIVSACVACLWSFFGRCVGSFYWISDVLVSLTVVQCLFSCSDLLHVVTIITPNILRFSSAAITPPSITSVFGRIEELHVTSESKTVHSQTQMNSFNGVH